ncbi:NAD(P)/FAD-dependent oxidoreductase [Gallaecimonas mangrovi]|uniref:NAD(P)/FAD-dependent oxidoreductase n=1 Tax=Gallaecimonas mangrovi TaxID=2291597 RepID=UPI000E200F47|nr:NAD(P)/FAD-dependent oxidoreductase [Gallaecimonas mangrovi]
MQKDDSVQVAVIGAGPSGALVATLLHRQGIKVRVLEKNRFPRFSIGESLLPQSMVYLEEAGLAQAVAAKADAMGFQFKNGAAFGYQGQEAQFDFTDKFSPGPGTTFQVKRAAFDKLLADEAMAQGVDIRFEHSVDKVDMTEQGACLLGTDASGQSYQLNADFVLDASGFARVLPRLFDLEMPSELAPRQAFFTHVVDGIDPDIFDRNKILISVHPEHPAVWYWLIPFADGTCSLGVVGEIAFFEQMSGDHAAILKELVFAEPGLAKLLVRAEFPQPVNTLKGYSAKVKSLYGPGYALLGNAGEFLDPVFSSGVTIAFTSASLAAKALVRQFAGETVDWQRDFAEPLQGGVDVFRTYVEGWYQGSFQDVIFYPAPDPKIKRMVCSILAGYAWDKTNPYVAESKRRLRTLAQICKAG